ncbi:MAG TPA: hypothetical protein PLD70_01300 [Thermotogota bacterium]|nr:hypothetical protein [Thermotogota bacterium]
MRSIKGFLLTAAILLLTTGAVIGAVPRDVSVSLDIYEQVRTMVETNIMKVDSIGFFNGTNSINRYDLADALYRLINYIMSTQALVEASTISRRVEGLESRDASVRSELALLRNRLDVLEVSFSPKELEALERRLTGLKDEVLAEMQGLEQRTKFVSGYSDFLTAVEEELRTLYTRVEEQGSRLTATEANTGRLLGYLKKYETLDTWLPTVEASFTKQEAQNARTSRALSDLDTQINDILLMKQRMESLQKEVSLLNATARNALEIPAIVESQNNLGLRVSNLEAGNATIIKVQQDLDYLKIENDQLKLENENVKKQLWYAFGVGIGGAIIGIASIVYTYTLWGGSQGE